MKKCLVLAIAGALTYAPLNYAHSYYDDFLKGAAVGAIATTGTEFVRNNLPDATHLNLHENYNMCRDRLTGELKAIIGILCTAAWNSNGLNFKRLTVQAAGVFTGIVVADFLSKKS